jgi:hypothetical protein
MASQRNITIECEHDLSLGDDRAIEIIEQECEERGYLTNDEDYLGGGEPQELEGFDIIAEGQTYNSMDIVEIRYDDCL